MTAVFLHFLNMSITAGWIVLAVLLLRLCLKRAPRWITCLLWGLVALRLVLPFSIESALSLIPTGFKGHTGSDAEAVYFFDGFGGIVGTFDMESEMVGTGFNKFFGVKERAVDHQMDVEKEFGSAAQRFNDRHTERDIGNHFAVHYIEVQKFGTGGGNIGNLAAELTEISGEERRGDQDVSVGKFSQVFIHSNLSLTIVYTKQTSVTNKAMPETDDANTLRKKKAPE